MNMFSDVEEKEEKTTETNSDGEDVEKLLDFLL